MSYVFFLGGHDLEMLVIRELLEQTGATFHDRDLRWGAKASAYREEITAALAAGKTAALVELENDLGPRGHDREVGILRVDHHGPDAGKRPTALEQVFALLELPHTAWTRWHALVAANDRGHIAALRALGASDDEIRRVRRADFAAQGISDVEWAAAEEAVRHRRTRGDLTVVELPHARAGIVADLLDPVFGGPGVGDLLVVSPGEFNFYGSGTRVRSVDAAFPHGWSGGDLPVRGFWGHTRPGVAPDAVVEVLSATPSIRRTEPDGPAIAGPPNTTNA